VAELESGRRKGVPHGGVYPEPWLNASAVAALCRGRRERPLPLTRDGRLSLGCPVASGLDPTPARRSLSQPGHPTSRATSSSGTLAFTSARAAGWSGRPGLSRPGEGGQGCRRGKVARPPLGRGTRKGAELLGEGVKWVMERLGGTLGQGPISAH